MTNDQRLGYLLNELCDVRGISHAIMVASDGLPIAASPQLAKEAVDQLSAVTSGLASLTNGAARFMAGGAVEHVGVGRGQCYLIVMTCTERSILTVLTTKECDLGQVSFEMTQTIKRVGAILTPASRQPLRA